MSRSTVGARGASRGLIADEGVGDKFGPPLHIAALTGQIDVIRWLLGMPEVNSNKDSACGFQFIVGKWSC